LAKIPTILTKVFIVALSPSRQISGYNLKTGHQRFLCNHFFLDVTTKREKFIDKLVPSFSRSKSCDEIGQALTPATVHDNNRHKEYENAVTQLADRPQN
jgi:hypothetical protein